jgi:methylase of polypeptide subunit release factors
MTHPSLHHPATVAWTESDQPRSAHWPSQLGAPPKRLVVSGDTLSADTAHRLASQGTAILWRGDFHNARQLLQALARRVDRKRQHDDPEPADPAAMREGFHRHRMRQAQRSALLNHLLIEVGPGMTLGLSRAPDIMQPCQEALGPVDTPFLLPLRALQGFIGAFEWSKKGVKVPGLAHNIHVSYGVYSPVRGEYLALLWEPPLPSDRLAFDIGTGSGVIAAILAQRGVRKVIATDVSDRALACARDNLQRLAFSDLVELQKTDLFPEGRSPLIVCNPPWIPAKPTTLIEHAIYDPDNRMLLGFLRGLPNHLEPGGEAWLVLSDLAERLGLRSPAFLPDAIAQAGLRVLGWHDIRAQHPKTRDSDDPLHAARSQEITSLWRLGLING